MQNILTQSTIAGQMLGHNISDLVDHSICVLQAMKVRLFGQTSNIIPENRNDIDNFFPLSRVPNTMHTLIEPDGIQNH